MDWTSKKQPFQGRDRVGEIELDRSAGKVIVREIAGVTDTVIVSIRLVRIGSLGAVVLFVENSIVVLVVGGRRQLDRKSVV